jgi:hypothetical protein
LGFGVGFFGGFGWGWHHWGADWHDHRVIYNHNTYISHSTTIINRNNFNRTTNNFNRLTFTRAPSVQRRAPHHPARGRQIKVWSQRSTCEGCGKLLIRLGS